MRAYIESAQPGTAIYHVRNDGWTLSDYLAAALLDELSEIRWRYAALHFEGCAEQPFPERVPRPGSDDLADTGPTWDTVEDVANLMSPQVLELMKGI